MTREVVRPFMGWCSSLPLEEFRSIESGLDLLARAALGPVVDGEGVDDAIAAVEALVAEGHDPETILLAGDSGGDGLACTVVYDRHAEHLPKPGGLLLFSPEVDLRLDQPSITDNAERDIYPWNIPTFAYLHGVDASDASVAAVPADVKQRPPVYLCWGGDEMFRDSIQVLAEDLHAASPASVTSEQSDMFHVFPILMPWANDSREVFGGRRLRRWPTRRGHRVIHP